MKTPQKKIILILISFLIILVGILLFQAFLPVKKETQEIIPTVTPFPTFLTGPTITFPPGGKIIIKDVEVRNFYPEVKDVSQFAEVTLAQTDDYLILYYTKTQQFAIAITSVQFEKARQDGENEFLRLLGINQIQACRLEVVESTVQFANPDLAGQTFFLSFCPQTP